MPIHETAWSGDGLHVTTMSLRSPRRTHRQAQTRAKDALDVISAEILLVALVGGARDLLSVQAEACSSSGSEEEPEAASLPPMP
eukprot:CAMPEP_0179197594 /NCGR_PEP_ID=MMETSP0796-20121207/98265_1 /TAXON_ID=73915 /ORGANISM="Pyrodinium bahamense, Strain pbaha01" /LENGTH=83 /DNA_ID=CAMNT_0020902019 /DNA_START=14 /DNA_END=264 /DNA_ORIENTATION=-